MIVNQRSIYFFRLLSDLLLLTCAFVISTVYSQSWEILIDRYYMFFLLIGLNLLWIASSNYLNFYDDFFSRNFPVQFTNILKNSLLQLIITITFIFLAKENLFTRYFIVYYFILLVLFISLRVITFRKILKFLRRQGKNIRSLVIVGEGELAHSFQKMILSNPDFGYSFKGFVSGSTGNNQNASEQLLENLEKTFTSIKVDEVVIALPQEDYSLIDEVIKTCNRNAVRSHIIPDYFKFVSQRFRISMLGNFPIITSRNEPLEEVQWRAVKRIFDFTFSLLVVVFILSILFPIVALLIKFSSNGPILFIQERIGAKNKKFRCYKFRTLKSDKQSGTFRPVTSNDSRITPLGRFLRKTNIDELPQFINVLKGEMSIVGPRPYPVPYDDRYEKIFEEIKLRHNVKPGISGWAQIHGLRGDVIDDEENKKLISKRIDYDLWYIENWSFGLDIQIIFLTIWQMIVGKSRGI